MNLDLLKSLAGNSRKVPTLAVLQFENLSGSEDDLHYSKGITEDILTQLSKIGELRVINKSNLKKYNHLDKSYREIGSELRVENLLLGSFRKIDEKVRVSARLVEADSEEQLWAETFDGNIHDYFSIQTEVALAIAQALEATITSREVEKMQRQPTESITAYDLFLKGKDFYSRYTIEDNLSALELFYQSIELDPNLAMAYAGISDGYSQMAQKSNDKSLWLDSALKYAQVALELDSELSDGHKSMGLYYTLAGHSRLAVEHYQTAVNIDQNIEAIINLSRLYYRTGRLNQALQLLNSVQWYHPMEENIWFSLAAAYYRLSQMEMAKESLDHALTTNPNHINSLLLKWMIGVLEGDKSTTFSAANKLARIGNDNTDAILSEAERTIERRELNYEDRAKNMASLIDGKEKDFVDFEYIYNLIAYLYQKGGLREKADSLFRYKMEYNMERILRGDRSYKYPYEVAEIHSTIGRKDKAIEWLGHALDKGWLEYQYGLKDPLFENMQDSEEFRTIIGKAKFKLDSIQSYRDLSLSQDKEPL